MLLVAQQVKKFSREQRDLSLVGIPTHSTWTALSKIRQPSPAAYTPSHYHINFSTRSNRVLQPVHNSSATYCSYIVLWFRSLSWASQQGYTSFISGQSKWDLWYTTWHWGRLLRVGYFLFPRLVSFRLSSIPTTQSSTSDATKPDFSTPSGRGQSAICIDRLTNMRYT